uniref:Uncharacterized protein n=1 Tax=Anguilla anguilla TaxID=7936 RepID=A0A0E9QU48_ANGAN
MHISTSRYYVKCLRRTPRVKLRIKQE